MSTEKQSRIYSGRLLSVGLLGGSPEWTAALRRRPTRGVAVAAALTAAPCVPYAGFPALCLAALLCGGFYADCEPLELLLLPETGAARLLARKTFTAWRNYFLLAAPFALLTVSAHPRSAWMAAAWVPFAALALFYFVAAKYARYEPDRDAPPTAGRETGHGGIPRSAAAAADPLPDGKLRLQGRTQPQPLPP